MTRNKPRLELALYVRPKYPGTYHYALFISKKQNEDVSNSSPVIKYHVKNTLQNVDGEISQPWRFERISIPDVDFEQRLLVRVVIGKVRDQDLIEELLKTTPVYQTDDPDRARARARAFNCVTWVRDAIEALKGIQAVSSLLSWEEVEREALGYVRRKKEEGRWSAGQLDNKIPKLDLLEGREVLK